MYKSSQQMTWELSPLYNVKVYRNPETLAKEEVLEDFILFLQTEYEAEDYHNLSDEEIQSVHRMITKFLAYDQNKVEQGERELLDQWIQACK